MSQLTPPQLGDYVTAKLAGKEESRQGVYVEDYNGTLVEVRGQLGTYVCEKAHMTTVPDTNLFPDTLAFVRYIRKDLNLVRE